MSDTEKMNEAMYERLGEIAKFASNKRVELDPDFKGGRPDDAQNRLMLAAFRELRQMCEFYKPSEKEPILPGCPSLMPRQLPGGFDGVEPAATGMSQPQADAPARGGDIPVASASDEAKAKLEAGGTVPSASSPTGADKAAKTADWLRKHYSFCDGLFPIRFTNTESGQMASCWIGGRHFTLDLDNNERDDGGHDCAAVIRDNGKVVTTIETQRGKAISGRVAYGAFKEYVRNLSGSGKLSSRGGFLKAAIKRAAAAKAAAGEVK